MDEEEHQTCVSRHCSNVESSVSNANPTWNCKRQTTDLNTIVPNNQIEIRCDKTIHEEYPVPFQVFGINMSETEMFTFLLKLLSKSPGIIII